MKISMFYISKLGSEGVTIDERIQWILLPEEKGTKMDHKTCLISLNREAQNWIEKKDMEGGS